MRARELAVREAVERIENFPGWRATGIIQLIDAILPDYTERAEHYRARDFLIPR